MCFCHPSAVFLKLPGRVCIRGIGARNRGRSRPWGPQALISPAGVFLFFPFFFSFSHALYRVSLRSTIMPVLRTGKLFERDILKVYVLQHKKKVVHIFDFCTKVFISILVLVVKKTGRCEPPIQCLLTLRAKATGPSILLISPFLLADAEHDHLSYNFHFAC